MHLWLLTGSESLHYGDYLNDKLWSSFKETLHTHPVDPHIEIAALVNLAMEKNDTLGKL